ncbi:MAG: hypothetical protein OXU20_04055 [Myxococcales bacterium]|nr:hypothetical protein [Myxococcales bacterium]
MMKRADFRQRRASRTLIGLFLICAATSVLYRVIVANGLEQTAVLFIGLPMFLGIALASTRPARTSVGIALKTVTFALLACGTLVGEGAICLLMAAPLFYGMIGIMSLFGYFRRRDGARGRLHAVTWAPLLLMVFEGTTPALSFQRSETVIVERVTTSAPEVTRAQLARLPVFPASDLPAFLRLGFPRPVRAAGFGLYVGDELVVTFAGGEGEPGDLTLRVVESSASRVRFAAIRDTSHIAHWLAWRDTTIELKPTNVGTLVRWTLRYERRLDPAWYFAPFERYAVGLAGQYLHDALVKPP